MDTAEKTIADLCRQKRLKENMTQPELGRIIGAWASSICAFEIGNRSLSPKYFKRILAWLGMAEPENYSDRVVARYKAMLKDWKTIGLPLCMETEHKECNGCNRCDENKE